MKSFKLVSAAAVVASLVLVGCGSDDDKKDQDVGIANPASVFCVEQGGESVIDGGSGICVLADGTEIDEWEYYRKQHGSVGIANPASEFCVEQGGESVIDGGSGICVLADGTEIDEWEYYRNNHKD